MKFCKILFKKSIEFIMSFAESSKQYRRKLKENMKYEEYLRKARERYFANKQTKKNGANFETSQGGQQVTSSNKKIYSKTPIALGAENMGLCEHCGWVTRTNRELYFHMQTAHNIKTDNIDASDEEFGGMVGGQDGEDNEWADHGTGPWLCEHCGQIYQNKTHTDCMINNSDLLENLYFELIDDDEVKSCISKKRRRSQEIPNETSLDNSLISNASVGSICAIEAKTAAKTEAERQENINKASGEAAAILAIADARARGLLVISKSLESCDGRNAATLTLAEQYISAFKNLAKTNNTLILPSNPSDISGLVSQALGVYKTVSQSTMYDTIGGKANSGQKASNETQDPKEYGSKMNIE